jgi:hypothetical protein
MVQETDYGFVITPRPASAAPAAAPIEDVGTVAPSPAVEPAATSTEPAAPAPAAEAVETQAAPTAPEDISDEDLEFYDLEDLESEEEAAAQAAIQEEPSVAQTPEAIEAEAQRSEEATVSDSSTTASAVENEVQAVTEPATPAERKDPDAHKAQMARNKAFTDDVRRKVKGLEALSTPVTPEAFEAKGTPDERTIALAEAGERLRVAQLREKKFELFIIAQQRGLSSGGKPTKARQMAIDAVEKFTPQERADFQRMYDDYKAAERGAPLKSTALKTTQRANPAFRGAKDVVSALRIVAKTGNAFEKLLANRIMGLVKGVQFVVVDQYTQLPANIRTEFDRNATQGVYDPTTKTVYVRDSSIGDAHGINNTVVLHEALHAATALKLNYALALIAQGSDVNKPMQFLALTMKHAMNRANAVYNKAKESGRSTPYLDALAKSGAFTDINEFVSYGFTDNVMQSFLAAIPGDIKGTSMWSRFVDAVRTMLGLGQQHQSALQDLMVTADLLMSQRLPANANAVATSPELLNSVKNNGKKNKEKADKIRQPLSHPEESLTIVGQLIKSRSWAEIKDVVSDIYNGTASQFRRPMLGALTTRQVVDLNAAKQIVDADGKQVLENVLRLGEDLSGRKAELLDATATLAKKWHQWQQSNPGKYRTLNRLIHLATINQIDPAMDSKSKTLNEMYESLGEDGKALYNEIREFYKDRFMQYKALMLKRIENSAVEDDVKATLIQKLEDDFSKMPQPYFPLVREGKYWLRVGNPKSSKMEYYMFEDPRERNFYARQRAKELGTTVEAMMSDESNLMGMGDDYKPLIDEGMRSSKMMKDIVEAIDKSSGVDKDKLKDDIYQLYLTTLPEQNFRKHFLHRKGTAGYRADALRNFAKSSFHTSVQLAKIEYGHQIRKELDRAWEVTKGNPQRDTLFRPIIDEMTDRTENVLSPPNVNELATKLANALGTASFVYYMSAPASAITNLTGLYVFGMPVLNGEFGPKANLVLAKNMNIFKAVGVTGKDGKFTFPTLLSKLEGRRREAYLEALRRGKIDTTLTYDTLQLSRSPSEDYSGIGTKVMNGIGYLFHHSEKINREVMYMTAYDLAYDRAIKGKRDEQTAHEEAMNEASRLTDEAMFDYSDFNKPRFFRGNAARVILQFKSFAQQTTFYLYKNFMAMFKGADKDVKVTAATKFFGTLGMTGMFAGALGLPLVSVITSIMSMMSEDDEDPEKRNARLRFRKWLREEFGDSLGLAIERGPISWATDVDFHSRVKLDQLWFRDQKAGLTETESLKEFIIGMLGPSVGLGINAAEAMRRINDGDVERGVEMLMPAGLRGFAASMRQQGVPFTDGGEGIRNLKGDKVVERNQLSETNRITTMLGFNPTKVAATQEDASQARGELDKVQSERTHVLTMFKDMVKNMTPDRKDAAIQALLEFNRKNPMVALDRDTIINAVVGDAEASATSVRGIRTTEKLRPMLLRLLPKDPYGGK